MGKDLKGKELGNGISQRSNGVYQARFVNRFGKRCSVYGCTLKEVRANLAQAISKDLEKKNVVTPTTTLDEWYDIWMRVYKEPVIRKNTKRHYEYIYQKLIQPYLGNKKLDLITKLMITDAINQLSQKGYQWESLNKVKVILIDMFNRAMEDDFMYKNPAKGVRLPKNKPTNYIKSLSREEQQAFFECSAGTFYNNLFVVAINTGLRPGELFALTEKDIDFKNKEILVTKTLLYQKLEGDTKKTFHVEMPKTRSSYRAVPINKFCQNALYRQIQLHQVVLHKSPYQNNLAFPDLLFTTKYGTPLNSVLYSAAINKIIEEINLTRDSLEKFESFSGHTFRHTFATRCFESGIQPKTVQTYLGHTSLSMTMDLYTSVMQQKKTDDIKLLESTIGFNDMPDLLDSNKIIKLG